MTRTSLGERDIIKLLTGRFRQSRRKLPLGFDDDVSAIPISSQQWLILKTDTLVGRTDVPPGMSLEQASRKAVVATVSDFAAKGVRPQGILLSLGLQPPVKAGMVREIANGISTASREYGCCIVGGDTSESTDLFIDCVGFGLTAPRKIIRRDGARSGDIVAVTGQFGKTAAGLRILLSKNADLLKKFPQLVGSITHPVARLETGLKLARTGKVSSSIDSSDGLVWSLHEIATRSRVKIVLDRIPVAPAVDDYAKDQGLDSKRLALYGGEEYELVLTIPKENFEGLKANNPSLMRIGTVEPGRGEIVLKSRDRAMVLKPLGWEHMISRIRS